MVSGCCSVGFWLCGFTFDANVSIQGSSNQSRDNGKRVTSSAETVLRDTQVGRGLDVLALVAVHEESVEHVADVDEELGAPHALQEITRTLDLGHELGEDHASTVGVDCLHHSVDGATEVAGVGDATAVLHRRVLSVDWGDQLRIDAVTGRRGRGGEQRRGVSGRTHGDEHDNQVDEDSQVGQPAELLEGSDLAQEETGQSPHQTADGVAELELGGLGEGLTVGDNDDSNIAQQLNSLEDVDEVTAPGAVDTERQITEGLDGELEGVEFCECSVMATSSSS